jgi:hypothetical protein
LSDDRVVASPLQDYRAASGGLRNKSNRVEQHVLDQISWIKLTGPRGQPVYVNVEQVTCVRPETQIPGAKAELDLSSGTFQGVQEDVAQVMQAIAAATKTSVPGA